MKLILSLHFAFVITSICFCESWQKQFDGHMGLQVRLDLDDPGTPFKMWLTVKDKQATATIYLFPGTENYILELDGIFSNDTFTLAVTDLEKTKYPTLQFAFEYESTSITGAWLDKHNKSVYPIEAEEVSWRHYEFEHHYDWKGGKTFSYSTMILNPDTLAQAAFNKMIQQLRDEINGPFYFDQKQIHYSTYIEIEDTSFILLSHSISYDSLSDDTYHLFDLHERKEIKFTDLLRTDTNVTGRIDSLINTSARGNLTEAGFADDEYKYADNFELSTDGIYFSFSRQSTESGNIEWFWVEIQYKDFMPLMDPQKPIYEWVLRNYYAV